MARGKSYPAIGLKEAIERAEELRQQDGTAMTTPEVAVQAWGYTSLNGTSLRVLSALRQYGLLADSGDQTKLSDRALAILVEPEVSEDRREAISNAAQEPTIFQEIHENFDGDIPSDGAIKAFLVRKRGFQEGPADKAIAAFRETEELVREIESNYSTSSSAAGSQPEATGEVAQERDITVRNPMGPGFITVSDSDPRKAKMQPHTIPLRPDGTMAVLNAPNPLSEKDLRSLKGWIEWYEKLMTEEASVEGDPVTASGDDDGA